MKNNDLIVEIAAGLNRIDVSLNRIASVLDVILEEALKDREDETEDEEEVEDGQEEKTEEE